MRPLHFLFLSLALAVLTVGAYLPLWQNGFVDFDDDPYILRNPLVNAGLTWSSFRGAWIPEAADMPYWVPLTMLSFQLDAQFFSTQAADGSRILSPVAFHAQNLFWHVGCVLLLFDLCRRLIGQAGPAFLVAALFAVHPMHVESVAWAIERKDVLSGFFGLLTVWAYVRYVQAPSPLRSAGMAVSLLLSLLAKPMLITLPCVLLLLDYWPLRRLRLKGNADKWSGTKPIAELLREKLPLFFVVAVLVALTLATHSNRGTMVSLDTVSLSSRLANALTGYQWYLATTFYPTPLAVLYPHPYDSWSLSSAVSGGALLLVCTLAAWFQRRQRPWLIVGWLWFVGTLLPVIGFIQVGRQAWADRFSYWPHIGLFLALVCEIAAWSERFHVPVLISRLAAAGLLGWLAYLTWGQVQTWRDTPTLWQHAVNVTRDNDQAHQRLGAYYHFHGQPELADRHHVEAVRIQRQRLHLPPLPARPGGQRAAGG